MAPKVSKKKLHNSNTTHKYNLRPRNQPKDSTKTTYISVDSKLPSCSKRKKLAPRNKRSESSAINCIICLDTQEQYTNAKAMTCGHSFHEDCINMWLKNKNTCPVCRAVIGTNQPTSPDREAIDHVFLNTFVAIFMMGYLNQD